MRRVGPVWLGAVLIIEALASGGMPPLASAAEFLRAASGICPQERTTSSAPGKLLREINPVESTPQNFERGKSLYHEEAKPTACRLCHGMRGNGNGRLAEKLVPPPRNFTCTETMKEISDGQLFWIIKNGSRSTAMPAHKSTLSDRQIWQLVLYLRTFAE